MQELGENQRKWLDALRSGEYAQGLSCLRSEDDKYCCLGVACEVAGVDGVPQFKSEWLYDGLSDEAPPSVTGRLALRCGAGSRKDNRHELSLINLNDTELKTFAEIADIIESDPGQYFTEPR